MSDSEQVNQAAKNNLPNGYQIVSQGAIQAGDLAWNESDIAWNEVLREWIGDEVEAYFAIARAG